MLDTALLAAARSFKPYAFPQQAYSLYHATKRFKSLDGWRAVAILSVIFQHTLVGVFSSPIASEGRQGVTLFFVISGFLIVTLLLRSKDREGTISLRKFWGRRILRIFPIYYSTLLLYIVLVSLSRHSIYGQNFFQNLPFFTTFTTNWFVSTNHDRTIFFFSWSLAAEEQFYLLWPVIEVLVVRPRYKFLLLGLLIAASQFTLVHQSGDGTGAFPFRILCSVPLAILLGTILAHLLHQGRSFRFVYALFGRRGSAFGCLVIAIGTLYVGPRIGSAGDTLIASAMMILVASCVVREDNDLAGVLRWPPLVWVGTVSYGMYMLHMLSVNIVRQVQSMLHVRSAYLDFAGGVMVSVTLASVSFLFYERRFLALKDRLFEA